MADRAIAYDVTARRNMQHVLVRWRAPAVLALSACVGSNPWSGGNSYSIMPDSGRKGNGTFFLGCSNLAGCSNLNFEDLLR